MSETEQPLRAVPMAHQCVCLLLNRATRYNAEKDEFVPEVVESKCAAMVNDPDSPFCGACEQAGHPNLVREGKVVMDP